MTNADVSTAGEENTVDELNVKVAELETKAIGLEMKVVTYEANADKDIISGLWSVIADLLNELEIAKKMLEIVEAKLKTVEREKILYAKTNTLLIKNEDRAKTELGLLKQNIRNTLNQ